MRSQPCRCHIHECPLTEAGCHDVPEPSCGDGNDAAEDVWCFMSIPGIDMSSRSCGCAVVVSETREAACAADKLWPRSTDISAKKIDLMQTLCIPFGKKVFSGHANPEKADKVRVGIRFAAVKRAVGYQKELRTESSSYLGRVRLPAQSRETRTR